MEFVKCFSFPVIAFVKSQINSKEILKDALQDYDGTLIIVSHDRDFLAGLTNKTLEFRDKQLHTYLGDINFYLKKKFLSLLQD